MIEVVDTLVVKVFSSGSNRIQCTITLSPIAFKCTVKGSGDWNDPTVNYDQDIA